MSSGAASSGVTYYLGGYEEHTRGADNVVEQRHYLSTPEGVVGVYTLRSSGLKDARYWHKDHLGSVAVITDAAGTIEQKFAFDPWGNRSVVSLAVGEPYAEERGYTGHEQLVEVGLVHMNGRLYDPLTGRVLQADPIVQDPYNGQSYNRYAYVLNNPLSFTDPTGFSWWTKWRRPILAIAAAATMQWYLAPWIAGEVAFGLLDSGLAFGSEVTIGNAVGAMASGFAAGGIAGGNLESAVQGAVFAGLNYGIGEMTGHMPVFGTDRFAANVGLHAALGCGQQAAAGGTCRGGAMAGGFSAFAGPMIQGPFAVQYAAHVVIGGTASRLAGGKFENGAMTAAFEYLFNYCSGGKCTSSFEQVMYDWWPGYKAGTLISNELLGGGGDWTAWEVIDGVSVGLGGAGKGLQLIEEGITVLGHFPRYLELADGLGANALKVSAEAWNSMNTAQRWTMNKVFLDAAIERGDVFVLATDIKAGMSYFRAEVSYLLRNGYEYGSWKGMNALLKTSWP